MLTVDPATGGDDGAVAVADDGTDIYVVGFDEAAGAGDWRWRIEKRAGYDGALITGFGTGGVYLSNPSGGNDRPAAVVHDGTHLFVAGYDETPGAGDFCWRVEKIHMTTGVRDGTFGGGSGVVQLDPASGGDDRALAIAWDGTACYVGGYDSVPGAGDTQWRLWAISGTSGTPVTAFNTTGTRAWNPSPGLDRITSLARDGSDLLAAGTDASPGGAGDTQWRVERIATTTGATVTTFAATGVLTVNPSGGADDCHIVADGSAFLLSGTVDVTGLDASWRTDRRRAADGTLVAGFATGGILATNPSPNADACSATLVTGPGSFVLVGCDRSAGASDAAWRIEYRAK